MNIILFITLIVLILIFAYQQIRYLLYKENFKLELDVTWVDDKKVVDKKMNKSNETNTLGYDFNVSNTKYNQLKEFIPDKDNYTIYKDTGIMIDIDKPIKLHSIEFNNLKKRLDFYRNLEHESRHGDNVMEVKKKYDFKTR